MNVLKCSKDDFNQILDNFECFWGENDSERLHKLKILHHPILIYELGDNAFVIKKEDLVIAYLFGLFSTTEPLAYVQFIAVHSDYKRKGLATALYQYFSQKAFENKFKLLKAITTPGNQDSINFHKSICMNLLGQPNNDGIRVIKDYAGPGQDRVVFMKEISNSLIV
jgi:ribosomal protein S18 acetylase RimI-like enzyme